MTAKLLVLYGPPEDATAFENHYEQTPTPLVMTGPRAAVVHHQCRAGEDTGVDWPSPSTWSPS